ncbi:MAG: M4 family metallopeptidase [Bacteroidales bacterium]|nr:M4 family metallopeptidase [Bacteroidales bacterium]
MKRLFLLLNLLLSLISFSQNEGHYSLNVEKQDIQVSTVKNHFQDWFDIDKNSTFEEIKDENDEIGFQHIAFQQYYKGIKVEHGVVYVHAKEGRVVSVNATLLDMKQQASVPCQSRLKNAVSEEVESMMIPIQTKNGVVYRYAYKTFDINKNADIYIDSETGDTIKKLSRTYYGMAEGEAYTMYHGWQPMSSYYENGYYYLCDLERRILTLDASNASYSDEVVTYRNNSADYKSASSNWSGILSSVTITSDDGDWWYTTITDTRPDFYIKIYSATGKLLYTSEVQDNKKSPVTFSNINVAVDKDFYIAIYDEDATSDEYGGSITITNPLANTYTWSGSYTSGRIVIKSNPALDAHWGMQNVYDYYLKTFNRDSYNGLGTMIYQFIDAYEKVGTHSLCNAFASYDINGSGYMVYGLGNGEEMTEVVALDVMAHEYTHMVTDFNGHGGLEYIGESGALNESFSDIFGCSVEFYTLGDEANWLIGEDIMVNYSNLRDMSDPKNSMDGLILKADYREDLIELYGKDYYDYLPDTLQIPQPDTYKGEFWADTSDDSDEGDNGGVHTNSGVQNKWFYLLCEGGNGTNDNGDAYTVAGIGIDKAQRIAYRNLIHYLTPTASYWDSRNGSLNAAKDLYGENSVEYKAVEDAWYAVGVGSISSSNKFVVSVSSNDLAMGAVMGSGLYDLNEEATLIAVPENGYKFVSWNDGNTNNPRKITVTEDISFVATFVYVPGTETRTISLFSNNNEWGTVTGDGVYELGEEVEIKATPKEGYRFVQWSDGSTQQERIIEVSNDVMLIATFEKIVEIEKKTITLFSNNTEWGFVAGAGEYPIGKSVEINAVPKDGYRFVQWNDGITLQQRTIEVLDNITLIATFEKQQTAIENTAIENCVHVIDNIIYITAERNFPIMIYDATGKCVYKNNTSNAKVTIPQRGLYFVKVGNYNHSVIIK